MESDRGAASFIHTGEKAGVCGRCSLFICLVQRKSPDTAHFRSLLS